MNRRINTLVDFDPRKVADFDDVIDVRSPGEFEQDHAPRAINLPVLSNDERARVGTIYKQVSKFEARRVGAALIARNIARHIQGPLADRNAAWRPLVYCWRGGQRSGAMATILSQVGWRTSVLSGGYKTYRRYVLKRLHDDPPGFRAILLSGGTGAGKTELLGRLGARGLQTLDLEHLADHRGSLFGALQDRGQPSQKLFESRIAAIMDQWDPRRPVVIEAESSRIGALQIPPAVWSAMQSGSEIEINAPIEARAAYLVNAYPDFAAAPDRIVSALNALRAYQSRSNIDDWIGLARTGDFSKLAQALIEAHYDPSYSRHRKRAGQAPAHTLKAKRLDDGDFNRLADEIQRIVEADDVRSPANTELRRSAALAGR